MPEGVGYGPQFTASVGKKLNYIGDHCYGLSGLFSFDDNAAYGLNFTSGEGYIEATVYFGYATSSGNNIESHILFNEVQVFQAESENAGSGEYSTGFAHVKILIPPYTNVKIGAINVTSSDVRQATLSLTGKVYGIIK